MAEAAFDYYAYLEAVSELTDYLIELKYVDDAFEFLRSPEQNLPAPSVVHELGWTYPFHVASSPLDDFDSVGADEFPGSLTVSQEVEHLRELSSAAATWGYGVRSHLLYVSKPLTKPVVSDFDHVGGSLRGLAQTLKSDNALAFGRSGFGLDGSRWEGNTAQAFFRSFVQPFTVVNENHQLAIAQMAACVAAGRGVVIAGQNALMNLVVTMRDTLKLQLRQRQASQSTDGISADFLTVVSTGLTVVGTLAGATGAGAPLGVALEVTGIGLGYAATKIPPEDAAAKNIEVAKAEDVESTLADEVSAVLEVAAADWRSIGTSASAVVRMINQDEKNGLAWPPRPRLGGVSPDDFHHSSSDQY